MKYSDLKKYLIAKILPDLRDKYRCGEIAGIIEVHLNQGIYSFSEIYELIEKNYRRSGGGEGLIKKAYFCMVVEKFVESGGEIEDIYFAVCDLKEIECDEVDLRKYYEVMVYKAGRCVYQIEKMEKLKEYVGFIYLLGVKMQKDLKHILEIVKSQISVMISNIFSKETSFDQLKSMFTAYFELKEAEIYTELSDYLVAETIINFIKFKIPSQSPESDELFLCLSKLNIKAPELHKKLLTLQKSFSNNKERIIVPKSLHIDLSKIPLLEPEESLKTSHILYNLHKTSYSFSQVYNLKIRIRLYHFYQSSRILNKLSLEANLLKGLSGCKYFPIVYNVFHSASTEINTYIFVTSDYITLEEYVNNGNSVTLEMVTDIISAYQYLIKIKIPSKAASDEVVQVDLNGKIVLVDFSLLSSLKKKNYTAKLYDSFGDLNKLQSVPSLPPSDFCNFFLKYFSEILPDLLLSYLKEISEENVDLPSLRDFFTDFLSLLQPAPLVFLPD